MTGICTSVFASGLTHMISAFWFLHPSHWENTYRPYSGSKQGTWLNQHILNHSKIAYIYVASVFSALPKTNINNKPTNKQPNQQNQTKPTNDQTKPTQKHTKHPPQPFTRIFLHLWKVGFLACYLGASGNWGLLNPPRSSTAKKNP